MNKLTNIFSKGPLPTQGMLVARLLVGGYLMYLGKSLFDGRGDAGMSPIVMYTFLIIFIIVGLFLCIKAVVNLLTGYYSGGKLDKAAENEEDQEAENVDETVSKYDEYPEMKKPELIDVEESEIQELDK